MGLEMFNSAEDSTLSKYLKSNPEQVYSKSKSNLFSGADPQGNILRVPVLYYKRPSTYNDSSGGGKYRQVKADF